MMDWKQLYFGKVSPDEVQEAIKDEEWQRIRVSMKGMSIEDKYETLWQYYWDTFCFVCGDEHALRMLRVRVTNYVTALSRGGLIKPEDYRK